MLITVDPAFSSLGTLAIVLIVVGVIILSILPIILFFKIWGMTNDVRYMNQILGTMLNRLNRQQELLSRIADNHDYTPPYESGNGWGEQSGR